MVKLHVCFVRVYNASCRWNMNILRQLPCWYEAFSEIIEISGWMLIIFMGSDKIGSMMFDTFITVMHYLINSDFIWHKYLEILGMLCHRRQMVGGKLKHITYLCFRLTMIMIGQKCFNHCIFLNSNWVDSYSGF